MNPSSLSSTRVAGADVETPGTPGGAALPVATVRAVVHEAGHEAVADHLRSYPGEDGVRYVDPPTPLHCAADVECLPLADVLGLGPETAGHLHRAYGPDPPADGSSGLAALAALIEARVARDLLDVRLAKAQHDLANLRVALETSQVIGIAVGVLMAIHHCGGAEAFAILTRAAQAQNRKLRDVARDVQDTGTVTGTGVVLGRGRAAG